jgi:hypothetical protein
MKRITFGAKAKSRACSQSIPAPSGTFKMVIPQLYPQHPANKKINQPG